MEYIVKFGFSLPAEPLGSLVDTFDNNRSAGKTKVKYIFDGSVINESAHTVINLLTFFFDKFNNDWLVTNSCSYAIVYEETLSYRHGEVIS